MGASVLAATATLGGGGAAAGTAVAPSPTPVPLLREISHVAFAAPPTTAQCEQQLGIACYDPAQYHVAYDLGPLYSQGYAGRGQTIAIVDSFGSPTIASQLAVFDKAFGLPAPPSLKIIQPAGAVPPFDPNNSTMVGWAQETSLDVEYSHAIAPDANILLVETPVAETEGVTGFPQIVEAENYVINNHMAQVISQSFGATEETFPNAQSIFRLRGAFINAQRQHVTVLASSGDGGATDSEANGTDYYLTPVNSWPSTDPLVTSMGGTQMHLNQAGQHLQPDTVWNDTNMFNSPAASGGNPSAVFARPSFQDSVSSYVGASRGTPDLSMSAAVNGGALVYLSQDAAGAGGTPGWYIFGGTSEASPLFAGVVAIATQYAGHNLGWINPALYKLASQPGSGIVDVTAGTNTVTFAQNGSEHTVYGHDAAVGYDEASGLGTIDAAVFVPNLVKAVG
ncbi:MAG TPA: S53 family peptidase [Acidimicrobiales bacterium]|nr:S53 family peptidase [Acidimicrobiales bacterium]